MEDMSRHRDRGQLILITGLAIAAVLVATVTILNAAIYTENLVTRDAGSDTSEAIEIRNVVVNGAQEILRNKNETDPSGALDRYLRQVEAHYDDDMAFVSLAANDVEDGSVEIEFRYLTSDLRYEDTIEVLA